MIRVVRDPIDFSVFIPIMLDCGRRMKIVFYHSRKKWLSW
jgi:hypothetical protein